VYLLDTNVVSELRRTRPHGGVLAFIDETPVEQLRLSAVTFGELQMGVELLRARDLAKANEIEAWIDRLPSRFDVLPADLTTYRAYVRLMHATPGAEAEDAMIAATALVHGLTVVTRNVRDFRRFGVPLLNPFEARR
jgi:toxin FitB